MRHLPALGLTLVVLIGCQVGTHARDYQPATGPAGAMVNLELRDKTKIMGELLAVDSSALLIRTSELVRIPLAEVRSGKAPKVSFDGRLRGDSREKLRLISRYPQGVSPELESQLLRAYGQNEVKDRP